MVRGVGVESQPFKDPVRGSCSDKAAMEKVAGIWHSVLSGAGLTQVSPEYRPGFYFLWLRK